MPQIQNFYDFIVTDYQAFENLLNLWVFLTKCVVHLILSHTTSSNVQSREVYVWQCILYALCITIAPRICYNPPLGHTWGIEKSGQPQLSGKPGEHCITAASGKVKMCHHPLQLLNIHSHLYVCNSAIDASQYFVNRIYRTEIS